MRRIRDVRRHKKEKAAYCVAIAAFKRCRIGPSCAEDHDGQ